LRWTEARDTQSLVGQRHHRSIESRSMTNAIEVQGLVKRFGDFTAVDHLDLNIRQGELLSMLGPNGAGKSTTLRILTTLMMPTEGRVTIGGHALTSEKARIKPLLGLVPQEIALYETLSARNNLRFFAQLYGLRGQELEARCQSLLEDVELADRADDVAVSAFSGGMQRRVNIAAALVHDPQIIFMDEPTVGLDPVSRTAIWKVIETLKSRGKTIVLTTHYMDEAEALCDRVAIVDHGKVVALGTPAELILQTGVKTTYTLTVEGTGTASVPPLKALSGVIEASATGGRITVFAESEPGLLVRIIETLLATSTRINGVEVAGPNLGAVFLHFTGRELRD
jgi:ABC-2 type transport system ATP-binding protein